jgi:ACS family hexuronate transporter-like MFS transporter
MASDKSLHRLGLLFMMSMTNAVVVLDRFSINYLSPYIVKEFGLNNTQVGMLSSGLSVAVAISGLLLSRFADKSGRRKQVLVAALVLFSLISSLSGLAPSFMALLGVRILLGVPDGPIPAVAQSIVALEAPPQLRGFAMGAMQQLGASIVGAGLGPILFTQIADAWGWRAAFFLSCAPGLILALCVVLFLPRLRDDPSVRSTAPKPPGQGVGEILKSRNVVLCVIICGFFSAWMIVQGAFTPLYLVRVTGLSAATMGLVMSAAGLAGAIAGVAMPAMSDRVGRKPMMLAMMLCCLVTPLAVLYLRGSPVVIAAGLFVGAFSMGAAPFVSIISAESVGYQNLATTIALNIAVGEVFGGIIAPTLAGRAADMFGLDAPFWFCIAMALAAALLSLLLTETAPKRSSAQPALETPGVPAEAAAVLESSSRT